MARRHNGDIVHTGGFISHGIHPVHSPKYTRQVLLEPADFQKYAPSEYTLNLVREILKDQPKRSQIIVSIKPSYGIGR